MSTRKSTVVIVGAGPAGLTAAAELLAGGGFEVTVVEKSAEVGGISRTCVYKGNRMDIGGHRFFSKSDRVMDWWLARIPLAEPSEGDATRQASAMPNHEALPSPQHAGAMLVRPRKSRVYYLRRFFDYPISLSADTLRRLGFARVVRVGLSYVASQLRPIRPERTLEDFFINRFGRELYQTFFQSYTEKVWGMPCTGISAEWGAQRIKGLSITTAVVHAIRGMVARKGGDVRQKGTETSLIERFLYPMLGPGQMWERVADEVRAKGARILMGHDVTRWNLEGGKVTGIVATDVRTNHPVRLTADYFISSMPIRDLVAGCDAGVPADAREVADGLAYRDFITVGVLLRRLRISDGETSKYALISDNWLYIQEPDVLVGRIQIFNNWSPGLVADPDTVWLGLEYFCTEGDQLWRMADDAIRQLASEELHRIGFAEASDVIDSTVIRVQKAYPAYFGTYDRFEELRYWIDSIHNLYCVGRNGMHRYNNQDHSMLTAMQAVECIRSGNQDRSSIWSINTEKEYHEEK